MRLTVLFVLIVDSCAATALGQAHRHREMVVSADMTWSYFVGTSEPDAAWRGLGFNEQLWAQGRGGFGYGDGDDGTTIPKTRSVYLRKSFTIVDISALISATLYMDYDDGFVAYLNGREIARSAGMQSSYPRYNELSTVSHEAVLRQGQVPESFSIPADRFQLGDNVLAVQVHNTTANSSDMTSNAFLIVSVDDPERHYGPLPPWLYDDGEILNDLRTNGSVLPLLVVTTENEQAIPYNRYIEHPKIMAHMGIIHNGPEQRNRLGDTCNEYDSAIGIEVRGFSSAYKWDKKPYGIETRTADGNNLNVGLFGFPKENDWTLNASYYDRSFIRNPLIHEMSRRMGQYSSRTRHCELILNGEYRGIYILMEKIKRDKNRVAVTKMDANDISGEALTGGYIYEYGLHGSHGLDKRILRYPKSEDVTPEQLDYIWAYDAHFRQVMQSSQRAHPDTGYPSIIDVNSFVDEMLIQEIGKSVDAYIFSSYFHKDRNGPLRAGPCWDFDQSFGNSVNRGGHLYTDWIFTENNDATVWPLLFADAAFQAKMRARYRSLRQGAFRTEDLLAYIDDHVTFLSEAQVRNFTVWRTIGVHTWREPDALVGINSYQEEIDYFKDWLVQRLEWLDAYFDAGVRQRR